MGFAVLVLQDGEDPSSVTTSTSSLNAMSAVAKTPPDPLDSR
jgi:hypothetical protein